MNKTRRLWLRRVIDKLRTCTGELERLRDAEDEARENIPDNLQSGDAYCESENCSDVITNAADAISDVISELDEIA